MFTKELRRPKSWHEHKASKSRCSFSSPGTSCAVVIVNKLTKSQPTPKILPQQFIDLLYSIQVLLYLVPTKLQRFFSPFIPVIFRDALRCENGRDAGHLIDDDSISSFAGN
jgi:hypothetical protein